MQTIRISRKLLYKAYGLAVSKRLASAKAARSVAMQQGKGAVFIARSFKIDCIDKNTQNAKKRIETPTKTRHNTTIDSDTMLRLLKHFDENNVKDKTELSDILNDMVVCCGYAQRVAKIGGNIAKESKSIVDSFLIVENGKEYSRNVTFQAAMYTEREIGFEGNPNTYTLLYAQDTDNADMFLIRLTPNDPKEIMADMVFESLVIMNRMRKVEIGLSVRPNVNKKMSAALMYSIQDIASMHLKEQKELMNKSINIPYDQLQTHIIAARLKSMGMLTADSRVDTFHPTYAFLRLQLPVLRFINTSSSPGKQTDESIPFLSQALRDLAAVHWVYAGLRSIAAAMLVELTLRDTTKQIEPFAFESNLVAVDLFLFNVAFEKEGLSMNGDSVLIKPRTIAEQTPEEMCITTALAADLVSRLYLVLQAKLNNEDLAIATRQLINLYREDKVTSPSETPSPSHYGHRIAVRLFQSASISMYVGDRPADEMVKGKPINLSIRKTTPWTSSSDSAQTWNALTRFTLRRRQMLNLGAWMQTQYDLSGKPIWAENFTTKSVVSFWDPVIASWKNHPLKPDEPGNRNAFRPDSLDTTAVIPVTLDIEQQVRFQVHTFLKRISGTTVQMDTKKKRH